MLSAGTIIKKAEQYVKGMKDSAADLRKQAEIYTLNADLLERRAHQLQREIEEWKGDVE